MEGMDSICAMGVLDGWWGRLHRGVCTRKHVVDDKCGSKLLIELMMFFATEKQ